MIVQQNLDNSRDVSQNVAMDALKLMISILRNVMMEIVLLLMAVMRTVVSKLNMDLNAKMSLEKVQFAQVIVEMD